MKTTIRASSSPFYGDDTFVHGISRSGYFNKRESEELLHYGKTLAGLEKGELIPENEEETCFVNDIQSGASSEPYPVNLWRKYINAVEKSKVHHGFAKNNGKSKMEGLIDLA